MPSASLFPGAPVYRLDDATAARIEGFEPERGWIGPAGPDEVIIAEGPSRFAVTLGGGHKTGFYLDQRDNRARVAAHARGRRVLDGFCYTGAFACAALAAGATGALLLESSGEALEGARRNLELNGLTDRAELRPDNAFDALRRLEAAKERFGLVVLDPPPFTRRKEAVEAAARGYKEINLRGLRLLEPGGILATFSCSHHVTQSFFEEICRDAAGDAGIAVRVLAPLTQGSDHPVLLNVPESRYLTGLLLQVALDARMKGPICRTRSRRRYGRSHRLVRSRPRRPRRSSRSDAGSSWTRRDRPVRAATTGRRKVAPWPCGTRASDASRR